MRYAGIDLSARRGFDVAVLDDERHLVDLWRAPTLDRLSEGLAVYRAGLVAGGRAAGAESLPAAPG